MVVSQNYGYPFGCPQNKDYSILGSILGFPYFGKRPNLISEPKPWETPFHSRRIAKGSSFYECSGFGFRGLGFRGLGVGVQGFRVWGFRGLGFRVV